MRKKIFLLDDDQGIIESTSLVLEEGNFMVFPCRTAEKLFSTLEKVKPNLILMDVQIPGENEVDLFSRVRVHPHASHVPIVLFSGNSELHVIGKRLGADGVIAKPYEIDAFIQSVSAYISCECIC